MNKENKDLKPVSTWLKSIDFKRNRLWTLRSDGIMKTIVDGKELTSKEFDKKFPVKTPLHFYQGNPENPDKRKSFMYDK